MRRSVTPLIAVVGALVFLAVGACGSEEEIAQSPTVRSATLTPSPMQQNTPLTLSSSPTPREPQAIEGAPITADDAATRLDWEADGSILAPVASWGRWIVVWRRPCWKCQEMQSDRFFLWDPETGERRDGWTSDDHPVESDGAWLLTVRVSGPIGTIQQILLRNLETGEVRSVRELLPDEDPEIEILPYPYPSISSGRVVWSERQGSLAEPGPTKVVLYDVASGTYETLFESAEGEKGARGPVIGGNRVVWVRASPSNGDFDSRDGEIVIHDLETGEQGTLNLSDFGILEATISQDGRYLVWGDGVAWHATELDTGETVEFSEYTQSPDIERSGRYIQFRGDNCCGGYYDLEGRVVRRVPPRQDCRCVSAGIFGRWFMWIEAPPLAGSEASLEGTIYYFLKLDP